jgi:hypothetical protein
MSQIDPEAENYIYQDQHDLWAQGTYFDNLYPAQKRRKIRDDNSVDLRRREGRMLLPRDQIRDGRKERRRMPTQESEEEIFRRRWIDLARQAIPKVSPQYLPARKFLIQFLTFILFAIPNG